MNCFVVEMEHYRLAREQAADRISFLREVCLFNRINALAQIYNAQHGWLGASLSAAELLTVLYSDFANVGPDPMDRDSILLGKGHAAAMQYAALAGAGLIPVKSLMKYKQLDGPQAHTDLSTPGIDINSGSLGQALSKGCGMAIASPDRRVFVILGDGEMQEGQNYEALMTISHYKLMNVRLIIDRNGIQSDSNVSDIMAIPDLGPMLKSFGFNVMSINGNDIEEVCRAMAWAESAGMPTAVIAETKKGAGISFMASSDTQRRSYSWHGGAPSKDEYLAALNELGASSHSERLREEINVFAAKHKCARGNSMASKESSTGSAFGKELVRLAGEYQEIYALDADLEKPCNMVEFARKYPDRYLEMGIAEQDMVSCAGGLALRGKLPAVNTYAAFYRRAYEHIYINATEKSRIIYAGHYAGLCYVTDGKSHTCTGDIAMMRAIPGMNVLYPSSPGEVAGILEWYIAEGVGPLYIKLHRTAAVQSVDVGREFHCGWGTVVRDNRSEKAVLTCGPHMTAFCAAAADALEDRPDVYAVSTMKGLSVEFVKGLVDRYESFIVIEENSFAGGLFDEFCGCLAELRQNESLAKWPPIKHKAVDGLPYSDLEQFSLYRHFGLDVDSLIRFLS